MHITKKFDRAFQWAGEKMGQEAKTNMSDDFKVLETEMALRQDGMHPPEGSVCVHCTTSTAQLLASADTVPAYRHGAAP